MLGPGQTDIRERIYKLNTPIFSQKKSYISLLLIKKGNISKNQLNLKTWHDIGQI